MKYSVTSESEPVDAVTMIPRERLRQWAEWVTRVEKERERQAPPSEFAGLVPFDCCFSVNFVALWDEGFPSSCSVLLCFVCIVGRAEGGFCLLV